MKITVNGRVIDADPTKPLIRACHDNGADVPMYCYHPALTPVGSVYAGGEEWTARTSDETSLQRGTPVRIVRQEGLTLIVETMDGTARA